METMETMETTSKAVSLSCFEDMEVVSIREKCDGDSGDSEIKIAVSIVSTEEKCDGDSKMKD
jgi:hypothetical protein